MLDVIGAWGCQVFERFTDRARRVVVLAQEESRRLNHNYIGTEHVLLGLIHEGEGVGAKALESLGVRLQAVRDQVEATIGRGESTPSGHIPFTPRAKKTLELALREALDLGHNYIGTEHILLGLIREGDGVAAQVLNDLGADLARVRAKVIELLSGYPTAAGGAITRTVFVASGHADGRTGEVAQLIEALTGRPPVVLREQPDDGKAILAAFEEATHPAVAVVILGGDREQVLYEMGWFHGRLGRRGVVALFEAGAEAPSVMTRAITSIPFDAEAGWRYGLGNELRACGVEVDLDNIA